MAERLAEFMKCPFCSFCGTGDKADMKNHLMVDHGFSAQIFADHLTVRQLIDLAYEADRASDI